MKILSIWHGMNNGSDFRINRPQGFPPGVDCVILTRSPAYFTLQEGTQLVKENHLIIYEGGQPQEFQGCGTDFIHDWFHVERTEEDAAFLAELRIPYATALPVSHPDILSGLIRDMSAKFGLHSPFGERILDAYIRCFFLWAADAADLQRRYHNMSLGGKHAAELHRLRRQIYEQPANAPSPVQAAAALFLSRSHFDALYKEMFGESYQNDVINSRMQQARMLLRSSELPVAQVATACGYASVEHFIRQFQQHTGMTPRQFRCSLSQ